MVVPPSVITGAKYGFLGLVFTAAGFLIGNVIVVKHHKVGEFADSLVYHHQDASTPGSRSVLDANYGRCLTDPAKSYCILAHRRKLRILRSKDPPTEVEPTPPPPPTQSDSPKDMPHPIHSLLLEFGQLMSSFKVNPVLLEPSMLYCLLSPSNKLNLIKKGFNPHKWQGSRKIVTVGIFEKEARFINPDSNSAFNFTLSASRGKNDPVHYFFSKEGGWTVHGVVLFEKQGFLWQGGLDKEGEKGVRDLLLVKESTYENFTAVPLPIDSSPELTISLPSNPVQFLHQLPTSEFQECTVDSSAESSVDHPHLTFSQLRNRVIVGVQELKAVLQTHFVPFWLWMDSLRGWNEECNIFSKTSELNVAVSYLAIREINLTSVLTGNDYLKFLPEIRLPEESLEEKALTKVSFDCYGLKINIFICFEEKDSIWSYVSPELDTSNRAIYPEFHLCTAEVYGQRVNIPCRKDARQTEIISTKNTVQENVK